MQCPVRRNGCSHFTSDNRLKGGRAFFLLPRRIFFATPTYPHPCSHNYYVESFQLHTGPVDLGAMWIHEADEKNPLMNLAKKLKLPLSDTLDATSSQLLQPDGTPVELSTFLVRCEAGGGGVERCRRLDKHMIVGLGLNR